MHLRFGTIACIKLQLAVERDPVCFFCNSVAQQLCLHQHVCTSFGGVGKHSNSWLVSGQHAVTSAEDSAIAASSSDSGSGSDRSHRIRIHRHRRTRSPNHQEECGYEFCTWFGL